MSEDILASLEMACSMVSRDRTAKQDLIKSFEKACAELMESNRSLRLRVRALELKMQCVEVKLWGPDDAPPPKKKSKMIVFMLLSCIILVFLSLLFLAKAPHNPDRPLLALGP